MDGGKRWPDASLFAVGWSLGANILTNFLGEEGKACKLSGAVAMCNPFDQRRATPLEGFFARVYSAVDGEEHAQTLRTSRAPLRGAAGYDRNLVENARTVRDFDEAVTRVTFGFRRRWMRGRRQQQPTTHRRRRPPALVIQAEDDPIAVREAVPREIIANAKQGNVLLVETSGGGHLGWSTGKEAPRARVAGYRRHAIFRGIGAPPPRRQASRDGEGGAERRSRRRKRPTSWRRRRRRGERTNDASAGRRDEPRGWYERMVL